MNEDAQLEAWIEESKLEFRQIERAKAALLEVWMADSIRRLGARRAPIHVDQARVCQLQRQGFSIREIGRLLGVPKTSVHRFANGYTCRCADCT